MKTEGRVGEEKRKVKERMEKESGHPGNAWFVVSFKDNYKHGRTESSNGHPVLLFFLARDRRKHAQQPIFVFLHPDRTIGISFTTEV